MSATSLEPALGVEGWLAQILLDGEWQDFARGYEQETKAWQRLKPESRRIVHWITRDVLVDATRPVRLWAVQAQVERTAPGGFGWSTSTQVPTFYLDPAVQGITDEAGALRVAGEILECTCNAVFIHVEPIY